MSDGQPQWSGPEKGNDGGFKSCRSQAHHGCSPDLLHVWLPIAAILLLLRCLSVSTWWSSPSLLQREEETERGKGIQEMNSKRTEGEGGRRRDTEREHK